MNGSAERVADKPARVGKDNSSKTGTDGGDVAGTLGRLVGRGGGVGGVGERGDGHSDCRGVGLPCVTELRAEPVQARNGDGSDFPQMWGLYSPKCIL